MESAKKMFVESFCFVGFAQIEKSRIHYDNICFFLLVNNDKVTTLLDDNEKSSNLFDFDFPLNEKGKIRKYEYSKSTD